MSPVVWYARMQSSVFSTAFTLLEIRPAEIAAAESSCQFVVYS